VQPQVIELAYRAAEHVAARSHSKTPCLVVDVQALDDRRQVRVNVTALATAMDGGNTGR
jgi:hypothetical protein